MPGRQAENRCVRAPTCLTRARYYQTESSVGVDIRPGRQPTQRRRRPATDFARYSGFAKRIGERIVPQRLHWALPLRQFLKPLESFRNESLAGIYLTKRGAADVEHEKERAQRCQGEDSDRTGDHH